MPGSATGGLSLRSDGALTWSGVMPKALDPFYTITTSDTDPLCAMPFATGDGEVDAYVDLEAFAIPTSADYTGDTTAWILDTGTYNLYGTDHSEVYFTDDGFLVFDAANYAGEPWVPQVVPNPVAPNNVAAMFWQDFEIFHDAPTNAGITIANLTSGGVPTANVIEYDNVQPFGGGTELMDFEVYIPFAVDPTGPELIYAYDNIAADIPGTIGVENSDGTSAEAALNNDLLSTIGLSDGDAICFDLTAATADPVVLTYQVTVDMGTEGTTITNEVSHTVDSIGAVTETSSVDVAIGDVTPPVDGATLSATDVLSSSLTLNWDAATDDVAVTGYGVYQDGALLTEVTGTTYDVTGLSPKTEYTFTVKAMDAQDNMSAGLSVDVMTAVDFTDDDFSIFEDDIEWLFSQGITRGCNPPLNDRYCPNDNLTRGQMAAMLTRALDLPAATTDYFTDDDDSVFEDDINAVAQAGITLGCNPPANDNYCPTDLVSRGAMAAMMDRALDLPATTTDFFTDDTNIFEDSINRLAAAGITTGCNPPDNDNYCPGDLLTRGQIAAFFRRALG